MASPSLHRTDHPVVTTPSSSALPSTAAPSSMPGTNLTPKTSKKKHTLTLKKDSARRRWRTVSPIHQFYKVLWNSLNSIIDI